MGLNPFREQRKSPVDIAMVGFAIALTVAVIIWALMG